MADKPHGHTVNQTEDIAGRVTSRISGFQRALSPWVQRRLAEGSQAPVRTGRAGAALTVAHAHSLVDRVQRLPEQSTVWRPNVGSLDPLLTDRFARRITERFAETGSRYQIQRREREPAESDTLPLAGLHQEESPESDTSFVDRLPFSVEEVKQALEKGSPAAKPDSGRSSAEAPVQRAPAPSGPRDRQFPFTLDEVRAALEKKPATGSPPGQTTPPVQRGTTEAPPVSSSRRLPPQMRRFAKIEEITPGGEPAEVPPEPPAFPGLSSKPSEAEAARREEAAAPEPVQRHSDSDMASSAPAQGETSSQPGTPAEPKPPEAAESRAAPPEAPSRSSPPEEELPLRPPESAGPGKSAGEESPTIEAAIRPAEGPRPVVQPKPDDAGAGQESGLSPSAASDQPARSPEPEAEPAATEKGAELAGGEGPAPEEQPETQTEVLPPVVQAGREQAEPEPGPVSRPELDRTPDAELPLRRPESVERVQPTGEEMPTLETAIRRAEGPSVVQPKAGEAATGEEPEPEPEAEPPPPSPSAAEQPVRRTELEGEELAAPEKGTEPAGGEGPAPEEGPETQAEALPSVVQAGREEAEPRPVVLPELDRTPEEDLPLRSPEPAEGVEATGEEVPTVEAAIRRVEGPPSVVQPKTDEAATGEGPQPDPKAKQLPPAAPDQAVQEVEFDAEEKPPGTVREVSSSGGDEEPAVANETRTPVESWSPVVQAREDEEAAEPRPVVRPEFERGIEPEMPVRSPEPAEGRTPETTEAGQSEETSTTSTREAKASGDDGPAAQGEGPPPVVQSQRDQAEVEPRPVVRPELDQTPEPEMPVRSPEPVEGRTPELVEEYSPAADEKVSPKPVEEPGGETRPAAQIESPPPGGQRLEVEPEPKPVVQPKLDRATKPEMPLHSPEPVEGRSSELAEGRSSPESDEGRGPEFVERRLADEAPQAPLPIVQAKTSPPPESGPELTLRRSEPDEGKAQPDALEQELLTRAKSGSDLLVTRPPVSTQRALDTVRTPDDTAVLPQARSETGFTGEGKGETAEEAAALPARVGPSDFREEGALPLAAPPRPAERVPAGTTGVTPSVSTPTTTVQRQETGAAPAAPPAEPVASSPPPTVVQRAETDELAPTAPEIEAREPDLDKLARQILPLIKRLLAVERDRRPFR